MKIQIQTKLWNPAKELISQGIQKILLQRNFIKKSQKLIIFLRALLVRMKVAYTNKKKRIAFIKEQLEGFYSKLKEQCPYSPNIIDLYFNTTCLIIYTLDLNTKCYRQFFKYLNRSLYVTQPKNKIQLFKNELTHCLLQIFPYTQKEYYFTLVRFLSLATKYRLYDKIQGLFCKYIDMIEGQDDPIVQLFLESRRKTMYPRKDTPEGSLSHDSADN